MFKKFLLVGLLAGSALITGCDYNHTGIKFVDIPAGSFVMGSCAVDKNGAILNEKSAIKSCLEGAPRDVWFNETPQRKVNIRAFQLGQTEVTFGQFKRFIDATKRQASVDFVKANVYGDDAPVIAISRGTAQEYVMWLNQSKPGWAWWDKSVYRLPSEAEWEYACRAGTGHTNDFCGGNNLESIAWYEKNSDHRLHKVATKQANAWGLFDMSGNASEWTQDCYAEGYKNAPTDGSAMVGGDCNWGVSRGGAQDNGKSEDNLRAGRRGDHDATDIGGYVGFRVAKTASSN